MPPANTNRENALAHVKTTLEANRANSAYHYDIDAVLRVDGPFFRWLDPPLEVMAFIEEGQTTHVQEAQADLWVAIMEVFITMAVRFEPDAPPSLQRTTDSESTVRSKILHDISKALLTTHTRGEAARNTSITDDAPVAIAELEEVGKEGWVAHEHRFEIEYEYKESDL